MYQVYDCTVITDVRIKMHNRGEINIAYLTRKYGWYSSAFQAFMFATLGCACNNDRIMNIGVAVRDRVSVLASIDRPALAE